MIEPLHQTIQNEVNLGVINPEDYSVVVTLGPHKDSIDDLEGIFWAWAEDVNQKEMNDEKFPLLKDDSIDGNQNNVFNVSKALNNVGYLNYW